MKTKKKKITKSVPNEKAKPTRENEVQTLTVTRKKPRLSEV